ncbi:putative tRNA (cytidine(34)-2'-O)-methyltransferase [Clostridia bacterium]|nr:putative tRNA (cytidine(34)-2'-O)-methyltransferase [Clostridia bacterium]
MEPEIPQNTGNIARTCAATGSALHLVRPLGFEVTDAKLKRAGLDYWPLLNLRYYDGFDALYAEFSTSPFFFLSTKADKCYTDIVYPSDCFLVFGKETKGLPESLITSGKGQAVRIPMIDGARSLNLSNSVAVVLYEVLRQNGFKGLKDRSDYFDR